MIFWKQILESFTVLQYLTLLDYNVDQPTALLLAN